MYDRDVTGTVVNVKGLMFYNTVTKKWEMDHAYKNDRPCLIIYSDDEYEYFLTMTSRSDVNKYFILLFRNLLYKQVKNILF